MFLSSRLLFFASLAPLAFGYYPHFTRLNGSEFSVEENDYLGSNLMTPCTDNGSFSVLIHGEKDTGKTSLVEYLIGLNNLTSKGWFTFDDDGASVRTRNSTRYKVVLRDENLKNELHVIDTPGFNREMALRKSLHNVFDMTMKVLKDPKEAVVPLKRIYLVMTSLRSLSYLKSIGLMYGKEAAKRVTLVLNGFDQKACRGKNEIEEYVLEIQGMAKEITGGTHNVLFTSAVDDRWRGCIVQLAEDLVRAGSEDSAAIPLSFEYESVNELLMSSEPFKRVQEIWSLEQQAEKEKRTSEEALARASEIKNVIQSRIDLIRDSNFNNLDNIEASDLFTQYAAPNGTYSNGTGVTFIDPNMSVKAGLLLMISRHFDGSDKTELAAATDALNKQTEITENVRKRWEVLKNDRHKAKLEYLNFRALFS